MEFPLFLIPIIIGLSTQLLKRFLNKRWLSSIKVQGVPMPRYGGMPSAHTAFALSLLTTVGLADGVNTTSFAMATAGTIFILDDALRMRIFLGRHGAALTKLIGKLPKDQQKGFPFLEARLGHKPAEVVVGAIIGVFGAALLYWIGTGII